MVKEPPGGIGGRLSKGHIDYGPFAATLDCLTEAMQTRNICTVSYRAGGVPWPMPTETGPCAARSEAPP